MFKYTVALYYLNFLLLYLCLGSPYFYVFTALKEFSLNESLSR